MDKVGVYQKGGFKQRKRWDSGNEMWKSGWELWYKIKKKEKWKAVR